MSRGKSAAKREFDVYDVLGVLWPYRRSVLYVGVGTFVVGSLLILFFVPARYEADAVFLPPSLSDDTMPFLSDDMEDSMFGRAGLQVLLEHEESPVMEVIHSRDVRLAVVRALDLVSVYGVENEQQAAAVLKRRVSILEKDSDAVAISAQSTDPELAKTIVEVFLHEIQDRSGNIVQRKVEHMARYAESRTKATDDKLNAMLARWQKHQEETAIFEVQTSARALSQIITNLIGYRTQSAATLKSMQVAQGDQNASVTQLRTYIKELDNQIIRLQGIQGGKGLVKPSEFSEDATVESTDALLACIPQGSDLPKLAAAEQRHRLEIESQVKIAALLKSQFEMARLLLIRQEQLMTVLDPPVVPLEPTDRKTKLVLILFFLSLLAGVGHPFVHVFWKSLRQRVAV